MRTRSASLSAWELGRPRITGLPPYAPMATMTIILTPARPMAFTDRSGSRVASSSAQVRGTTAMTDILAMNTTGMGTGDTGTATTATGMGAVLIAAIAVATGVAASAEMAVFTAAAASMEEAVSMAAGTAADAAKQACQRRRCVGAGRLAEKRCQPFFIWVSRFRN